MKVPEHMEITASLMAGYRFRDGSLIEISAGGRHRVTDADGTVLIDDDLKPSPLIGDYGELMDDVAVLLLYDADLAEMGEEDSDQYVMLSKPLGAWAMAHRDELGELANYREARRLTGERGDGLSG